MSKTLLYGISGRISSGKDTASEMLQFLLDNSDLEYSHFLERMVLADYSYEFRKFADKLKDIICVLLNCTRQELEDRTFKETPIEGWERIKVTINNESNIKELFFSSNEDINQARLEGGKLYNCNFVINGPEKISPRKLMQIFGTDCGRDLISTDIWCRALFNEYKLKTKKDGFNRVVKNSDGIPIDFLYEVEYPKWIINDLRYPRDEGRFIKDYNGLTIGIKRKFILRFPEYSHLENQLCPYEIPYNLYHEDPDLYKSLTFESEEMMGNFDWCDRIIENDGTLEDLFNNLKIIVNENSIK